MSPALSISIYLHHNNLDCTGLTGSYLRKTITMGIILFDNSACYLKWLLKLLIFKFIFGNIYIYMQEASNKHTVQLFEFFDFVIWVA